MILRTPKNFTSLSAIQFVSNASFAFKAIGQRKRDFVLNLEPTTQIDILGSLLLYKFVEFTALNGCFNDPEITLDDRIYAVNKLTEYGFYDLIESFMQGEKAAKELRALQVKQLNKFFIAPTALIRADESTTKRQRDLMLAQITRFYSQDKVVRMISQVICEVLSNFWQHAVDDSKTILVAEGTKGKIEIACADTANGLVSTLRPVLPANLSNEKIVRKALEKGITSKKGTDHMGYGLWILSQIAQKTGGRLILISEGVYCIDDRGKLSTGKCGYWKGTVIYINLPLSNPITFEDLDRNSAKSTTPAKVMINFAS